MPLPPYLLQANSRSSPTPSDAWDDDWETAYARDDRAPVSDEARNAKLWSDANAPGPSYTILPSTASTSSSSTSRLPPPQALTPGPALTILKRPTSAPSSARSSSASASAANTTKTLQQREREYEQARRRIYGEPPLPDLEPAMEGLSLGAGAASPSGPKGARNNSSPSSKSSGNAPRKRTGRGNGGGGGASATSSSSSSSLSLVPDKVQTLAEGKAEGVMRAPKGPNGESGGFGFASERVSSPGGRGRGRGR